MGCGKKIVFETQKREMMVCCKRSLDGMKWNPGSSICPPDFRCASSRLLVIMEDAYLKLTVIDDVLIVSFKEL